MTRQLKDVALAVAQKLDSPVFHYHSDHNKKTKMKTPLDQGGFHAASEEIELLDPFTRYRRPLQSFKKRKSNVKCCPIPHRQSSKTQHN